MPNTSAWWVGQGEMDPSQLNVVAESIDQDILVTGPPGSGKTNLLLLRANNYYLAGRRNIAIITFTRLLREFIASGAAQYDFPAEKIQTCREWQIDIIRQFGGNVPETKTLTFEKSRERLSTEIRRIVEEHQIEPVFDAILLDEAQDYKATEIEVFRKLAVGLFMVADARQQIYEVGDPFSAMRATVDNSHELEFHYRNGLKICKVADEIAKGLDGHTPLAECSNYPEGENPSTVLLSQYGTVEEQAQAIVDRIPSQLTAFPREFVGVLCPLREDLEKVWKVIASTAIKERAMLVKEGASISLSASKPVIVASCHAAKGLEFRSLHIAATEGLKKFGNNRRIIFTSVTRAKTSLTLYHSKPVHGYLDSAVQTMVVPQTHRPTVDDLFGGGG